MKLQTKLKSFLKRNFLSSLMSICTRNTSGVLCWNQIRLWLYRQPCNCNITHNCVFDLRVQTALTATSCVFSYVYSTGEHQYDMVPHRKSDHFRKSQHVCVTIWDTSHECIFHVNVCASMCALPEDKSCFGLNSYGEKNMILIVVVNCPWLYCRCFCR